MRKLTFSAHHMGGVSGLGEVLQKLMQSRGIDAAQLAALMREAPEAPAITKEDVEAMMTAAPGEEFLHVVDDLESNAFPREN